MFVTLEHLFFLPRLSRSAAVQSITTLSETSCHPIPRSALLCSALISLFRNANPPAASSPAQTRPFIHHVFSPLLVAAPQVLRLGCPRASRLLLVRRRRCRRPCSDAHRPSHPPHARRHRPCAHPRHLSRSRWSPKTADGL